MKVEETYKTKAPFFAYANIERTIFTHHDTFLHMHLITTDKSRMGHCDEMKFDPKKIKLYLPN
jgi:acetolactate decarboxylase